MCHSTIRKFEYYYGNNNLTWDSKELNSGKKTNKTKINKKNCNFKVNIIQNMVTRES